MAGVVVMSGRRGETRGRREENGCDVGSLVALLSRERKVTVGADVANLHRRVSGSGNAYWLCARVFWCLGTFAVSVRDLHYHRETLVFP